MRRPVSITLAFFLLSSVSLPCGASRAADPVEPGRPAKEDRRLSSFVNMTVNSTVIIGALVMEAMTGAMGDAAVGLAEGAANGLDNTGDAKRKGGEMREEMSRDVSAMVREMAAAMLPEARSRLGAVIDGMTPAQRKDLLADIGDESYDRVFAAIRKHDFGLPRLTEPLSVDDILGYFEIARKDDPRFTELMESMKAVKEPRVFAGMKSAAVPAGRETEQTPPEAKAEPVPPTIRALPATYLFPPGAETTISLRGDKELKIGWESMPGPGSSFANYGIMVRQGSSATSTPHGGMTLHPEEGKIVATMKNLEAFPIAVRISAQE